MVNTEGKGLLFTTLERLIIVPQVNTHYKKRRYFIALNLHMYLARGLLSTESHNRRTTDHWEDGDHFRLEIGSAMTCVLSAYFRVHFAGTESATVWCGFINGAVQAGYRAASEVSHRAVFRSCAG